MISQNQNNPINPPCQSNQMIQMNQMPSNKQWIDSFSQNLMNYMDSGNIVSGNENYGNDKIIKKYKNDENNKYFNKIDKKNNEINKERNSSPDGFNDIPKNNRIYLSSDDLNNIEEISKISCNNKNNNIIQDNESE